VPRKFVALKGPVDLGGAEYRDEANGARTFSPAFHADILRGMGVSTVVRLNEPHCPAEALASRGSAHHSLECPARACPPDAAVVDAAPGAVAVHCRAGLGRSGTLIALYLMRSCGFTAREAMGWLRIMRPGSVIGRSSTTSTSAQWTLRSRPPVAGRVRMGAQVLGEKWAAYTLGTVQKLQYPAHWGRGQTQVRAAALTAPQTLAAREKISNEAPCERGIAMMLWTPRSDGLGRGKVVGLFGTRGPFSGSVRTGKAGEKRGRQTTGRMTGQMVKRLVKRRGRQTTAEAKLAAKGPGAVLDTGAHT
jgi:hypothetical protein